MFNSQTENCWKFSGGIDSGHSVWYFCPEQRGEQLFFFAHNAEVTFYNLQVEPLLR